MNNIILIGMPGVGKSTIGIVLAKYLGREFIDTDIILQNIYKKLLHQIIAENGMEYFQKIEEGLIKSLSCDETVIATGGSVVLSNEAMEFLKTIGKIIYLEIDPVSIIERINNIETRGIVKEKDQTLMDIFNIRTPLYEKYSDIVINCSSKDHEQVLNDIIIKIKSPKMRL